MKRCKYIDTDGIEKSIERGLLIGMIHDFVVKADKKLSLSAKTVDGDIFDYHSCHFRGDYFPFITLVNNETNEKITFSTKMYFANLNSLTNYPLFFLRTTNANARAWAYHFKNAYINYLKPYHNIKKRKKVTS